ncbi:MAG: sensor histidine kinase YesM [Kiritimatiellia bacterium]|jgi:sensor histidine kinase YesM
MRLLGTAAGVAAVGALVAFGALGVLHHQPMPLYALVAGVLAAVVVLVARTPWSHLPLYIGSWLDLGVAVAVGLLAAIGEAVSFGFAFVVLRGPEIATFSVAAGIVGLAVVGLAYTHLRLAAEVERQALRVAKLERSALQSRLSVLSAQINPHFLFNTLNTLAEVVHEDEDVAEELVTDLAAMMRSALRSSTGQIPLTDELDMVRRLLRIESARFGDRLFWEIVGEESLTSLDVNVPGLLIQPLVENAVKYAVAPRLAGGSVHVRIEVSDNTVYVRIVDDGPGLPPDVARELLAGTLGTRGTEDHGGGLRNCLERLALTWPGGTAKLHEEHIESGTCLVLELPIEGESP